MRGGVPVGLVLLPLIYIAFGAACAAIAKSRNRNPVGWFFVGFFTGLIGIIIVLVIGPGTPAAEGVGGAAGPAGAAQGGPAGMIGHAAGGQGPSASRGTTAGVCRVCGGRLAAGATTCPECGASLGAENVGS